jgi:hypothetical protein
VTDAPNVTVLMPVYNGGGHLAEAIESVLDQTYEDFELLVVDDGSTDDTPSVLARYEAVDPRVRVHRQANRGLIDTLNSGCELARGELVARMDADDVSAPTRLERQVGRMSERPDLALLGTAFRQIDDDGAFITVTEYPTQSAAIARQLPIQNCIAHPTVVFRREMILALGGYRRAFAHAEDYDLWVRISEHHPIENLAEPLLSYRTHVDKVTLRNIRQQMMSTLAVSAAARRRRETGDDGLDGVERITPEVLDELGVPRLELEERVFDACQNWAVHALELGYDDLAFQLAQQALASVRPGRFGGGRARDDAAPLLPRRKAAGSYRIIALVNARQGRPLQAARSFFAALASRPTGPFRRPGRTLQAIRASVTGLSSRSR